MRPNFLRIRGDRLHLAAAQEQRSIHQDGTLHITNKDCRYRLAYGSQFKQMLQARDQVLEHEFDFNLDLDSFEKGGQRLIESQLFNDILLKIQDFLLEATSNVTSAAFKLLCKGDLNQNEAKEYASKNIMLNIRSVFHKTVTALQNTSLITQKVSHIELNQVRKQLAVEIDYMVSNFLVNLADSYPQAPAAGGTVRMRDAILDIKRVEQEANDLIFAYGIKIQDFIEEENKGSQNGGRDLTKFIMKVVNTAIGAVNSTEHDSRQRSLHEKFTEFCETMFPLVHQEDYPSFIGLYDGKKEEKLCNQQKQEIRKSIVEYFSILLEGSRESLNALQKMRNQRQQPLFKRVEQLKQIIIQEKIGSEDLPQKQNEVSRPTKQIGQKLQETPNILSIRKRFKDIIKNSEQSLEDLRKSQRYAMGQKIPAYVKEFTRQEIESKGFRAEHSSVLRVMTKWAENLKDILLNPQQVVYKRVYPFKTTKNEQVHLDYNDENGAEMLISKLHKQKQIVQEEEKVLLESCYKLISEILCQDQTEKQVNVKRYSDTRIVASKINAVLTFLMLRYLNLLIHHLIQAGKKIMTDKGSQDINLIVFRIGDLLRSKLQCSEAQFISLLKTMYVLDESEEMQGKFKLVRIKNKLDDPANNIIINYLFMGRVQCQLQLSIQEPKGKAKNYYTFSHFVYQLTRGRFGTIAECASMISQLDPMIIASKGTYYSEKTAQRGILKTYFKPEKKPQAEGLPPNIKESQLIQSYLAKENTIDEPSQQKGYQEAVFHCFKCQKLVVNQSTLIFKQMASPVCNMCLASATNPQKYFKDRSLRQFFIKAMSCPEKSWFERVTRGYRQVTERVQESKEKYLIMGKVNERGQLSMHLAVQVREQLKTMVVKIDSQMLAIFQKGQLDFCSLDSIDINKLVKKEKKRGSSDLIYFIKDLQQVKQFMRIDSEQFQQSLHNFREAFIDFRLQKAAVKSIKAKSEVLNATDKPEKFQKLDLLISSQQTSTDRQRDKKPLTRKYNKHMDLDFLPLKEIHAQNIRINKCPDWLRTLSNLKLLNFNWNRITKIEENELPSDLSLLYLQSNQLENITLKVETLRQVYLNNNKLASVNLACNLPHLLTLSLSGNQLSSVQLPRNLQNLRTLDLSNNKIQHIDFKVSLPSLTKLYLSNNQLTLIDLNSNLPNLSIVFINNNQLAQIGISDNLERITVFDLSYNMLGSIDLSRSPTLSRLFLNNNQLSQLDLSCSLNGLKEVYVYNNKLASIPKLSLSTLEILHCDQEVAANINFQAADNLKQLVIYNAKPKRVALLNLSERIKAYYL